MIRLSDYKKGVEALGSEHFGFIEEEFGITAEEIFQLLHDINREQGTTVLMSTHNFTMIDKFTSRTICIEDGNLIDTML